MRDFRIEWPEAQVARVLERVRQTELPPAPEGAGWSLGCDSDFLEKFRSYWLDRYDWRAAEKALNAWPQYLVEIDGVDVHLLHIVGEGGGKRPLLLTHGWPGSHYEFFHLIERLAYPGRHGGDPADAFDVVIPTLIGYGYSGRPAAPVGPRYIAGMWNRLMTDVLGYRHYLAQGGDWGSLVTSWLGIDHHESVASIHLNMMPFVPAHLAETEEEKAFVQTMKAARSRLSGYSTLQMVKPHSLALATADNPLGIASWILGRFHDWSDRGLGPIEDLFGLDDLVTNVMIYVMSGSFASSLWLYHGFTQEGRAALATSRITAPTAYAAFPHDALQPPPPRSLVERLHNIVRWTPFDDGGHFAAMERPEAFLTDVREWGRQCWRARERA